MDRVVRRTDYALLEINPQRDATARECPYRQNMATVGIIQPVSRRRRIVFTVVASLVALALLSATANVLAPWTSVNIENLSDATHARWSLALEGIVDLLGLVCIVGALLRPARSALLVQYLLYAAVLAAAVIIPFSGPMFFLTVGVLLLVPLTYPHPRELFSLSSPKGPSQVLLAVGVVAAAVLSPVAVHAIRIQATLPRGSGSDFNILATDAEHLLLLALAGLLAATRRPGWQVISSAVTATYTYLGLASILLANQPNSWGVAGGAASLVASAAFGIAAVVAARRDDPGTAESRSVTIAQGL
jgi:hypothetical protein